MTFRIISGGFLVVIAALVFPAAGIYGQNKDAPAEAEYKWWSIVNSDGRLLYAGAQIVGKLNSDGAYYPHVNGAFVSEPDVPPIPPPQEFLTGKFNQGVDAPKTKASKYAYAIDGVPATREDAFRAIGGGGGLVDDSGMQRLTLVGDNVVRAKFKSDWANSPVLASWRDKVLVQDYGPGDWPVAVRGLKPGLTLHSPDGTILASAPAYESPELLDRLLKRNPLLPSFPTIPPAPFGLTWPVAGCMAAVAYLLLRKRS